MYSQGTVWHAPFQAFMSLTIGAPVVQSLREHSDTFFDCHLTQGHLTSAVVQVVLGVTRCMGAALSTDSKVAQGAVTDR